MELMLRHYENECTFHTVECLRCGEEVLHRELSAHFVAGCTAAVSTAATQNNTSPEPSTLTLQDVTAALEELKTLLRDANHEQLLLAIQSEMNELIEQIRNQEPRSVRDHSGCRGTCSVRNSSSRSTESFDVVARGKFSAGFQRGNKHAVHVPVTLEERVAASRGGTPCGPAARSSEDPAQNILARLPAACLY
ncbi:hypothetical protein MTO96_004566 [Rhipicephalus appendiculatus]